MAGTVRRYNPHVRVRHLSMIRGRSRWRSGSRATMKKASPKSHHEALELYPRARTLEELEAILSSSTRSAS